MDINDYLIEQDGKDWAELLSGWHFVLPEDFTLWLVNRFGDLFIVTADGAVYRLTVDDGILARVADDREDFARLIDMGNNANDWLMIPLVDRCVAAGMRLGENQCYGYKVPPLLAGGHEFANIEPTDLSVHLSFLADIARQTKDLPDGTKIRVVIGEEPQP